MISNVDLINAFINGQEKQNGSMWTNGTKLYSYATCIAQKTADGILFNVCKYSCTTSKQLYYVRRALEKHGRNFTEVGKDKHIPRGTYDLTRYHKAA